MSSFLRHRPRMARYRPFALGLVLVFSSLQLASAKDVPLTGILLYGTRDKMAYVQVSGFLINGKTELRACSGSAPIEKNAYKNLSRVSLTTIKTLERLSDGSMVAQIGDAAPSCVVPSNFKWDQQNSMTPAELAEKSTYTGDIVGSSDPKQTSLPPIDPGAKLLVGSATDKELAEYSLVDRMPTIAGLQAYLSAYGSSLHAAQARTSLTMLLVKDGNASLAIYQTSRKMPAPDYGTLKLAHDRADQAIAVLPANPSAIALRDAVRGELKIYTDDAAAKLKAFQDAITSGHPGYALLLSARTISDQVAEVDPKYPGEISLAEALNTETHSLETLIQTANRQIASKQYDEAYSTIWKYRSIAEEEPQLARIVTAVYQYHLDKGEGEISSAKWDDAIADLKDAVAINATDEAKTSLEKARTGFLEVQNRAAADKALAISKGRAEDNNTLGAYEVLADLTPDQRLLVSEQMTALQGAYVTAAIKKATELQSAHTPIRGRADEDALRLAYTCLNSADTLSGNPEIGLKMELMADTISKHYVDLANRYLSKPLSSGVGLGWAYLNEATQYRPNLDAIRDAMTTTQAAYQMRARLSVGVQFRDQTSRRDSAGFADQLQQAFATGLETSGLPVRVILPGGAGTLEPNFQFVGEILQHRTIRNVKKETLQSQYRSGTREIPNEAWNKADQVYEGALLDLQHSESEFAVASGKGKKAIDAANADVSTKREAVQQSRGVMNSIARTVSEPILSPYSYTRTTLEVTNIIELAFRTVDLAGATVGEPIRIIKGEQAKKFVILDNINPADTRGLKEIDAMPDENQLMTDVEIEARDTLVKAARERVQELPNRILTQARNKAVYGDLEGAAEFYVLYLNCTPAKNTPERTESMDFLSKSFNIRNTANLRAAAE